jgi:hypothetical protein
MLLGVHAFGQSKATTAPKKVAAPQISRKVVYCVTTSGGAKITYVNGTGGVESATVHPKVPDGGDPPDPPFGNISESAWSKLTESERGDLILKELLKSCAWSYTFIGKAGTTATLEAVNGHGWVTVEAYIYGNSAIKSEATTYDDYGIASAKIRVP